MRYASRCIANDTIYIKQLAMRCNTIHPLLRFTVIRFRFNTMQWKKIWSFRIYFFGSDRQQIFWFLTPRGLFHKQAYQKDQAQRLYQKDFFSVSLTHCQMIWFYKANLTKINLSHCGYLCWKANLLQGWLTVRLNWAHWPIGTQYYHWLSKILS